MTSIPFQLDKKDFRILFELDGNSRQSIHDLAKKTKVSRDVVAYRMKQLEKKEIIQKYITIIDFSKLGYQILRTYIKLKNTSPDIEQQIIDFFLHQKSLFTIYRIDGKYDLAIGFLMKDLRSYSLLWDEFLRQFKMYVLISDFNPFLNYIHYRRNYLVEKKYQDHTALLTGSSDLYPYDQKDLELLDLLKEDARISLLDIAKKLQMTAAGVKYKLRNLEKNNVIVAYKLLLDYRKLGYEYYKVDLELEDVMIIPALTEFISRHPHIIYRDIAVGGSDFEFDCELRSQEEFYKLIDEIKALFPGKIRQFFYYKSLRIYKYSYFPEELKKTIV